MCNVLDPTGHYTSPKDVFIIMFCHHNVVTELQQPPAWNRHEFPHSASWLFQEFPHYACEAPSVAASGKVIVNHSAQHSCTAFVESWSEKGRQRAALAQLLWLKVCAWACTCANAFVRRKVSGDMQSGRHPFCLDILLILTAHIPRLWRFGNGLLDSDCLFYLVLRPHYPITASPSIILPSVRECLAPQVHSILGW